MVATITEREHYFDHQELTVDIFRTSVTVTVTQTPFVIRKWIRSRLYFHRFWRSCLVVGLGVNWTVERGKYVDTPAATLQLCIGRRCLIFQFGCSDTVSRLLWQFIRDPNKTFVGIWNNMDKNKLFMMEHELEMYTRSVDLRQLLKSTNGENLLQALFETIVEDCLGIKGVRLDKWICMSNWDEKCLSYDQVLQACVDAHVSFLIGKKIRAWI